MSDYLDVRLTLTETLHAAVAGAVRHFKSVSDGRKDRFGKHADQSGIAMHIEGAGGEIAVARVLKTYCGAGVDEFKAPDLGERTQVRTRSSHDYDLLVRGNDSDDHLFILVTGSIPDLRVHGWIEGKDAKKKEYLQAHGGRSPAYFIPKELLRPLSELL